MFPGRLRSGCGRRPAQNTFSKLCSSLGGAWAAWSPSVPFFTQTLYHPSGGLSRGGLKGEGELTANVPNIFDFYHIYGVILRIIIDIDSYGYRSFGLLVVILDAVDGNINGFKYIF